MASAISEIIKESIEQLRRENLNLTPDNYHRVFCNVAKKKGLIVEDCQKIDKFSKKLDEKNQSDLKKFKVSTIEELISFLIAKVNRANEHDSTKVINALVLLSKRVLQAVTLLHDKDARELANSSLSRLDFSQNLQSIDALKEKWFEFVTQYNDDFLKELDAYGSVHKDDLQKMVQDIKQILQKDEDSTAYDSLAPLIIASLVPSIASSMNDELADISYMLRNEPSSLETQAVQREIKRFINKRINLDKEEIKVKISSLDRLLDEINKRIINLINSSDDSHVQVGIIKKNLQDIDFSQDSFELVHAKLVSIATSLEGETKSLNQKMKSNHETIHKLHSKVKNLENALKVAKKEMREDFTTHTATKRALEEELKRTEDLYLRYKIDFSLCFLDIDHFKVVNDTYGHEAGDIILSNIGKILKRYIRRSDFVGRYGGEEFLVILPSISDEQAFYFAEKIRTIIESFKFLYKNERIVVTVSCGLSQRSQMQSLSETVEHADKMLYKAKESGRNKVMPDFS
ncbi:GGDEF domain-containing protein [Sulfurospirillum sp. 1612]|uniref:GGDEF domain-containing protein n=1 Tax=Sulfurospirillum sp. 1612 TaxID=3094835 RepID=UPI002F94A4BE